MKKLLFTLLTFATCTAAFAQGKVSFRNDSLSLVTYLGQPVGSAGSWPGGVTLAAGLYGGATSSALFLFSTTTVNIGGAAAGTFGPLNLMLGSPGNGIPGIPSGTPITASTPWFQARVWDNAYASYDIAVAAGALAGEGPLFQMNPGTITFVPTAPPSINSTWTDVPIELAPEPSTFALAGLAAGMFVIRHRKSIPIWSKRARRCSPESFRGSTQYPWLISTHFKTF